MAPEDPRAVLITGAYGAGKSTVAAEMADRLERAGLPYAYLDLDHLGWGYAGDDEGAERQMMLRNLGAVAANFRSAGAHRFVLAGYVAARADVEDCRAALDMPLDVVRLTLPIDEIRRRLSSDVTRGREDDLRTVPKQLELLESHRLDDLTVANDRPVGEVAHEILDWLGWA